MSRSAVVVSDSTGTIKSVNDQTLRMFGFTKTELIGSNVKILMSTVFAQQHDSYMQSYLKSGRAKVVGKSRIVQAQHKDGHQMRVMLALSHIVHGDENLFSALIDELPESAVELRVDQIGMILDIKGPIRDVLGYTVSQLKGQNVSMICPRSVAQHHQQFMARYHVNRPSAIVGQVRNLEALHKDGHLVPVSLEVVEDSTSGRLEFVGKLTEVEGSIEGVVSVSQDGLIEMCSDSCRTLFGYESSELISKPFSLLSTSIALRGGTQVSMFTHKDGSTFFASVEINKFQMDDSEHYRGIIKRVLTKKAKAAKSSSSGETESELIFKGDIVGWYEIGKTLGSGFFGEVKLAKHRLTGEQVAIKTLKRKQYADAGMAYPPREVELLGKLNHPRISRLFDSIWTDECIFMVTELVTGGELFDYVAQKDHLSEKESCMIFRQIVSAVDYMHRCGIVHRDLKMENVLMSADRKHISIIDLGLGNFYDASGDHLLDTFCGSADYASPELWKAKKYHGPEVDVWSIGVILFVLTTGFIPFNDSNHVMQIRYTWPKQKYSAELKDLVENIFQYADRRIDMAGIIAHPWTNRSKRLGRIEPVPAQLSSDSSEATLDAAILEDVVALGFPVEAVEKAVLADEHNQLSATYNLLKSLKDRVSLTPSSERNAKKIRFGGSSPDSEESAAPSSQEGSQPSLEINESHKCVIV